MQKKYLALALLFALFMMGCAKEPTVSTMTIHKDGVVESYIVEEFVAPHYDAQELENSVLANIASVNEQFEQPAIELTGYELVDGILKATIEYQNPDAYEEFNEEILYVGHWEEAETAGYQVGAEIENDGYQVVVFSEPVDIRVPKKIVYVSDGIQTIGKKAATVTDKEKDIYYIIYE